MRRSLWELAATDTCRTAELVTPQSNSVRDRVTTESRRASTPTPIGPKRSAITLVRTTRISMTTTVEPPITAADFRAGTREDGASLILTLERHHRLGQTDDPRFHMRLLPLCSSAPCSVNGALYGL